MSENSLTSDKFNGSYQTKQETSDHPPVCYKSILKRQVSLSVTTYQKQLIRITQTLYWYRTQTFVVREISQEDIVDKLQQESYIIGTTAQLLTYNKLPFPTICFTSSRDPFKITIKSPQSSRVDRKLELANLINQFRNLQFQHHVYNLSDLFYSEFIIYFISVLSLQLMTDNNNILDKRYIKPEFLKNITFYLKNILFLLCKQPFF